MCLLLDPRKNLACEFTGGHQRCVPEGGGPLRLTTFQGTKVYLSHCCRLLRELKVQGS